MKKTILTLSLLTSVILFSQTGRVGINTENPQNTFHVDGGKDNPASGAPTTLQQANDVIVTNTGQIGIGTTTPSQNLDVATGNVRIRSINANEGTATTDKVVVADANGVLKTIPKQNSIIFGGDLADISPTVTVTALSGATGTLVRETIREVSFTIDYESLVTFDYQLSYVIPNTTLLNLADGRIRRINSELRFISVPASSTIPINVLFAASGVPFTVSNSGDNVIGQYYLNGGQTLRLVPGIYKILLIGGILNSSLVGGPNFTVDFANAPLDFLTITAQAVQ